MALPVGLTTIIVTGSYVDATGATQAGSVSFTPTSTVTDAAGKTILTGTAVTAVLSAGAFSVTLPCTDTAGLTPLGWAYQVNVAVAGAQETFTAYLPHALGSTVDISALAPVTGSPAPSGVSYLPNTSTPPGSAPALGGGFLYALAGNLLWLGTGGTPETIAPSEGALPLTALGDTLYQSLSGPTRLPGNTTTARNFLTQTGAGSGVSAAPAWGAITAADVPSLAYDTLGAAAAAQSAAQAAGLPRSGGTMTGSLAPAVVTLTDAATITVNAAAGNDFRVTIAASRTMGAPTNPVDGQKILFQITQGGSGSFALTWPGAYEFSTGLPSPTLSTTAGTTDLAGFIYNAAKGKWLFAAFAAGFA